MPHVWVAGRKKGRGSVELENPIEHMQTYAARSGEEGEGAGSAMRVLIFVCTKIRPILFVHFRVYFIPEFAVFRVFVLFCIFASQK